MSATIIPAINDTASHGVHAFPSSASSPAAGTVASEDGTIPALPSHTHSRSARPRLGDRKSSGTMIVSSETASLTVVDDDMDIDDVRNMSPRRNSDEVERLTSAARRDLMEQARLLQTSLQAIVDRVETVKSEHEKLEGGNKFLQSYIGELMQTSRITSTAVPKSKTKPKGRSVK